MFNTIFCIIFELALPCSRVGHIFRSRDFWQGQVFSVGHHVTRNKIRCAEMWMDEFKDLSKSLMPKLPTGINWRHFIHQNDIFEGNIIIINEILFLRVSSIIKIY